MGAHQGRLAIEMVFQALGVIDDDHRMAGVGAIDHGLDILLGSGDQGDPPPFGIDTDGFCKDPGDAVS